MDPLHVLVVSADALRQQALTHALRGAGLTVLPEPDRAVAVEALAAPGFDAVVVDLALPGLDRAGLRHALRPGGPSPPDSLETSERHHVASVLEYTGGNRRRAALFLGISRSTLLHKIRRYGLEQVGRRHRSEPDDSHAPQP